MLGGRSRFASRRLLAASTQSRAVDAKNDSFAFGLMQGLLILQSILESMTRRLILVFIISNFHGGRPSVFCILGVGPNSYTPTMIAC